MSDSNLIYPDYTDSEDFTSEMESSDDELEVVQTETSGTMQSTADSSQHGCSQIIVIILVLGVCIVLAAMGFYSLTMSFEENLNADTAADNNSFMAEEGPEFVFSRFWKKSRPGLGGPLEFVDTDGGSTVTMRLLGRNDPVNMWQQRRNTNRTRCQVRSVMLARSEYSTNTTSYGSSTTDCGVNVQQSLCFLALRGHLNTGGINVEDCNRLSDSDSNGDSEISGSFDPKTYFHEDDIEAYETWFDENIVGN